ncbi:MAG: adenylate/guanylate cyclase domain-containing protein [Bacteroidota bacterium]
MNNNTNHILLTLIAFLATNVLFLILLIIDEGILWEKVFDEMSFLNFVGIANAGLLGTSLAARTFKGLGDVMTLQGYLPGIQFTVKLSLSISVYVAAALLATVIHYHLLVKLPWSEALAMAWKFSAQNYFIATVFFIGLTSVLMFFISNLERRSGSVARLFSQSMGEVLKPRLTERGFMFIDLNNATSIAEKLGSERYANLLRDCFGMLNELVALSPFEVYQYVGDEAVITWKATLPKSDSKSLDLFMDFKAYLEENDPRFIQCYGIQPRFKCAINSGWAVQSEIGKEVKHLVYHGDVLNTTARLLGQCHLQNTDIIISETAIVEKRLLENKYELKPMRYVNLKGKKKIVSAFVVKEARQGNEFLQNQHHLFSEQEVTISHLFKTV